MSAELKPCPFCSSEGYWDNADRPGIWWCGCRECGADTKPYASLDEAVAAWNRRATPAPGAPADIRAGVLEEAAKVCDALTHALDNAGVSYHRPATAERCARAIRELASAAPEAPGQEAADARDAARWRYAVAIGGNQCMNWLDVYDDWDGDGDFADAIDAAIAPPAALPAGAGEGS